MLISLLFKNIYVTYLYVLHTTLHSYNTLHKGIKSGNNHNGSNNNPLTVNANLSIDD